MTCYQRHLGWLFEATEVPYDKEHRRDVHEAIVRLVGLPADAHCPEVWSALKATYGVDSHTLSRTLVTDLARQLGDGDRVVSTD